MLREADTRPPARPGANAGASSSTRPPCAPTPGSRNVARAISSRARARWPGCGGADDRADVAEAGLAHARRAELVDERREALPHALRRPASLRSSTSAAPGFDVRTSASTPAPRCARGRHERLDRVPAHQRVDRGQVGAEPGTCAERRVDAAEQRAWRKRLRGDVDVAALAVGDHEQAAIARRAPRPLRAPPSRARRARSKRASWGLTATHAGAVASISARQCASDAPRGPLALESPRRALARRSPGHSAPGRGRARARSATRARPPARPGCRRRAPRRCQRPFTALFSPLPAVKRGTREAAIWMRSPVRGLTPGARAALARRGTCRIPTRETSLPRRSASSTVASTASTARAASCLVRRRDRPPGRPARTSSLSPSSFVCSPMLSTLTAGADGRTAEAGREGRRARAPRP